MEPEPRKPASPSTYASENETQTWEVGCILEGAEKKARAGRVQKARRKKVQTKKARKKYTRKAKEIEQFDLEKVGMVVVKDITNHVVIDPQ